MLDINRIEFQCLQKMKYGCTHTLLFYIGNILKSLMRRLLVFFFVFSRPIANKKIQSYTKYIHIFLSRICSNIYGEKGKYRTEKKRLLTKIFSNWAKKRI
jgi:hypothetical protein